MSSNVPTSVTADRFFFSVEVVEVVVDVAMCDFKKSHIATPTTHVPFYSSPIFFQFLRFGSDAELFMSRI